jgi:hypothetical protein
MARKKTGITRSRRGTAQRVPTRAPKRATKRSELKAHKPARRDHALRPAAAALAEDHRHVEALFSAYAASADEREKQRLVEEMCAALIVHTAIEEEIFYPACRDGLPRDEIIDVAQVEHDGTKVLIADLLDGDGDDAWRDAKVAVLAAQISHHVAKEEKSDGVFAQAAQHGIDTDALARRLLERKQALQRRAAELRPTRAISLQQTTRMEDAMARYSSNERERDERGRFMSDDDDDRRGYRGSSRSSRSRYDDDDDRGGRGHGRGGWFGDSEGHSRAARERFDDDDGGRGPSRSRYDDDRGGRGHGRGGWFGDSEGHSRAARERDDDDRGRGRSRSDYDDRGRDRGGWFGDSEGHSEASRRGWERSDHEGSGWYGDRGGHSEASRRGWERSDHEGSGWYGDRRGHAEASRRGWERSDHEGSGWYGDPEGHSEAARRRWEDDDRRGRRSRGTNNNR